MLGRRKRRNDGKRRIFFATDIHGSEACFRKWLNAARAYKAGVLILGGDITGKIVVPLVRGTDGRVRGEFAGETILVDGDGEGELESVERRIRDAGAYPLVLSEEEERRLAADAALRDDAVDRCVRETATMWRDLAEERLAASGAVAYMTLGNDDSEELAEIFAAGERLRYAEDKICLIDGAVELASFGYSTPTPWHTAREMAEEELEARLRALVMGLSRPEQAIFNVHCPPRDTAIDQAPQLDDQLRPRAGPGGGLVMEAVGSTAVRRIIETVGPQLALHGHVHESPGMARVGRTLCINPGSDYASGVLRGAIIDLDEAGSVRSWQLVQG